MGSNTDAAWGKRTESLKPWCPSQVGRLQRVPLTLVENKSNDCSEHNFSLGPSVVSLCQIWATRRSVYVIHQLWNQTNLLLKNKKITKKNWGTSLSGSRFSAFVGVWTLVLPTSGFKAIIFSRWVERKKKKKMFSLSFKKWPHRLAGHLNLLEKKLLLSVFNFPSLTPLIE